MTAHAFQVGDVIRPGDSSGISHVVLRAKIVEIPAPNWFVIEITKTVNGYRAPGLAVGARLNIRNMDCRYVQPPQPSENHVEVGNQDIITHKTFLLLAC